MSTAIIDGTNIDLSVLSYSAPKPNAAGGKVVNLYNKHAKESLTISVPLMGSWGAQESKEVIGKGPDGKAITRGTGKYTMSLQFSKGQYTTPEADRFLEQMKLLENKIKEDAMSYSKEWFGKEIKSMDVMDEKISPMLKYPKIKGSEERNCDEPPSLTVKLPCWKDVWQTSVFDEDCHPLYVKGKTEPGVSPLDFLVSTSKAPIQVIALIQCGGLWFVGNPSKVSITWNLKQVLVRKPKTSSIADDTCFLTIRPAELESLKAAPQPELPQDDIATVAEVESDGEEDYKLPPPMPAPVVEVPVVAVVEPVVEAAPTPAPAPKKKAVVKKKTDV
ncbi:MAG: hypothetical protein ACOVRN_02920 [Flavobacterium sp.]